MSQRSQSAAPPSSPSSIATSEAKHRPWGALIALAALATLAGLVWLGLSSRLADTGRQIAALDARRQALLERRVAALVQHAEATNPRHLFDRAADMGFVAAGAEQLERLPVRDPGALRHPDSPDLAPLGIARLAGSHDGTRIEPADVSSVLMSLGAAAPASADETESGEGR